MLTGRDATGIEVVAEVLAGWDPGAVDERLARTRLADALVACTATVEAGNPSLARLSAATDPEMYGRVMAARIRSSEIDDVILRSCTTPASVAVPAALAAVVAAGDIAADRLLASVAAGYATVDGYGRQLGGVEAIDGGQWPTRAAASVGAAATVAVALGLDEAECRDALTLASASAWTGKPPEPARQLIFGTAVGYGVLAALMAADGVHGGAGPTVGAAPNPADLGPDSLLAARVKPFCCAQQAMTSVNALLDLVAEHRLRAEEVHRIDVWIPPACRALIDRPVVTSRLDSIASLQYQLAAVLYSPAHLWDVTRSELAVADRLDAVASMTHIHPDPELQQRYPAGWAARVVVATAQGDHIRLVRDDDPADPETALAAKIDRLASVGGADRARLEGVGALCSEFASGAALLDGLSRRVFVSPKRKDDHAR